MKTKTLIVLLTLFITHNSQSQAPNWIWETNPNGVSPDGAAAIVTDAFGNIYVTGYFYGSSIDFGGYTLTNVFGATRNMFIVKYDPSGSVLWAQSAGGNHEDAGYSVATDKSNNVYVTGYFFSPSITFGSTTLINQGDYDMFLVKYDPLGTVLWAKSAGRGFDDYGRSVTTDLWNNVYVTGSFQSSSIIFESTTLINTDASEITYDMYLAKYDSLGNLLWAKSAPGDSSDYSRDVCTDPLGNIYVTGNFNSTSLSFGSTVLTNAGSYDMYLAKYDSAGTALWAKSAGGNEIEHGTALATDFSGNIYITGGFESDTIAIGTDTLMNSGAFNIYLAKYDSFGVALWAKNAAGNGNDSGLDIATDIFENAYVTGYFTSSTLTFGSNSLTNSGGYDIFIVKYDITGTASWAKSAGDLGDEEGFTIATNGSFIYIAGRFNSSTIDFANTLYLNGGYDAFLSKMGESGIGITETSSFANISIYPNPFDYQATILFSEMQTNSTIKIIDILGKEIKNINFSGNHMTLKKGEMKSGIYFIQIIDENNNISNQKIAIQ